jgi:hypothetical protein
MTWFGAEAVIWKPFPQDQEFGLSWLFWSDIRVYGERERERERNDNWLSAITDIMKFSCTMKVYPEKYTDGRCYKAWFDNKFCGVKNSETNDILFAEEDSKVLLRVWMCSLKLETSRDFFKITSSNVTLLVLRCISSVNNVLYLLTLRLMVS